MSHARRAALAVILLWGALVVEATEAPPVDIALEPYVELPQVGQVFTAAFELSSDVGGTITDVGFASENPDPEDPLSFDYWQILGHDAPPTLSLLPSQVATVSVQLMPTDPIEPLRIEFKFDGKWVRQDFYLMPRGPFPLVYSSNLDPSPGSGKTASTRNTSLAIPGMPNGEREAPGPDDPGKKGNVQIRGHVSYFLPDGSTGRADGVVVRAYDKEPGAIPDYYLGGQVTDPWGNFDFTVNFPSVTADLYLEIELSTSIGSVVVPSAGYQSYKYTTIPRYGFNGYLAEFSAVWPSDNDLYAAVHLQSTLSKAWRWLNSLGYGGIDDVAIVWPTGDNASYKGSKEQIYVSKNRQWDEYAVGHEYGHHWVHEYSARNEPEYCNTGGYGDDGDDCSHTAWCPENFGVAWSEGFAQWFGSTVRKEIEDDWGPTQSNTSFETIGMCGSATPGPFESTEGLFAAFLIDIADGSNESDPQALIGGEDKLNFGASTVLSIADDYNPVTPMQFLGVFLAEYAAHRTKIWATAANNRYDFDAGPPPDVAALTSISHQSSGDSPDRTVEMVWTDVSDPDSGMDYYIMEVAPSSNFTGGISYLAEYGGYWNSPELDPGTYWFRIKPVDRAGHAGNWTNFSGGITIREAVPPDLVPSHGTWTAPVIAKNWVGDPQEDSSLLFGNLAATYVSMSVGNAGELDATGRQHHRFYVDGALSHYWFTDDLPSYGQVSIEDIGPFLVRGGRHTLTLVADADEELSEVDESNNWFDRHMVWTPANVGPGWMPRSKAPDAWGGYDFVGIFASPNCDGFGYDTQSGVFRGAVAYSNQLLDDHDLRIFAGSTGSNDGFETLGLLASSSRPAGCLDAVFTVNDVTTGVAQNVGVYNFASALTGFEIRMLESVPLSDEVDVAIDLADGEYIRIFHTSLAGGLPGGDFGTLRLNSNPADGPLNAAVFSPAVGSHAGLDDPVVSGRSDENGELMIEWQYTTTKQLVAVWQDPIDVPAAKADKAVSVTLWVGRQPPDLIPYKPAGWYAPVVPTHGAPGTAASVAFPPTLVGNAASTFFNLAVRNDSPVPAGTNAKFVAVDGGILTGTQIAAMSPYQIHTSNYGTAYTIQGGRHTISALADGATEVEESRETNNAYAMQWVWTPLAMPSPGGWVVRGPAPVADGGWLDLLATPVVIPTLPPVWFNCDGLRTPNPSIVGNDGWWQALAVLPAGDHDVDVRLHEASDGSVIGGFQIARQASLWAGDGSDYVLVNHRNTSPRPFDVGVSGFTLEGNGYYAQTVQSYYLGANPSGEFGPFAMGSNNIMRLHEIYFDAGWKTIQVNNFTGTTDWGMTLHRAKLPYQSKTSVDLARNSAWLMGGPGGDEALTVEIPEDGYYCLAVWRVDDSDLTAGRYKLFVDTATSVEPEEEFPIRTQLVRLAPNPFNPRIEIAFALREPGRAQLTVYNARGERVRLLRSEAMEAGTHEIVWNGIDDAGHDVASGVYFVELRSGAQVDRRKITLLK